MFKHNLKRPFLRYLGVSHVVQSFVVLALYLILYPALVGSALSGVLASSALASTSMATAPTLGTTAMAVLAGSGLLTLLVTLYVISAMILAGPRVATRGERMFEALDESLQRTKGSRPGIMVTLLPFGVLLTASVVSVLYLGSTLGLAAYVVFAIVSALYLTALVTELNDRLG